MSIIDQVKNFVEEECKKPTSKYGYEVIEHHLIPMINCAKSLQKELGGDKEIILVSAWLHDIGSIIQGREDHHISGAKIAGKKLKEMGYPKEKIELVKKCILNHRGSTKNNPKTIEEKIIAEADAMSNFDNLPGIFNAAYIFEGQSQSEAKISARKKLQNKWNQLQFDKSKEIIRPKYEAAMLLLK